MVKGNSQGSTESFRSMLKEKISPPPRCANSPKRNRLVFTSKIVDFYLYLLVIFHRFKAFATLCCVPLLGRECNMLTRSQYIIRNLCCSKWSVDNPNLNPSIRTCRKPKTSRMKFITKHHLPQKKTQICAVPNPENPRNLAPARGFRCVEENCEGWKGIRESSSLVSASGRGSKRFQRTIERGAKMVKTFTRG